MNKIITIGILLTIGLVILLALLSQQEEPPIEYHNYTVIGHVKEKGDRLLGIAVTEGNDGFEKSFLVAKEAGIDYIEIGLDWNAIETSPGSYDKEIFTIINSYYPTVNTKVLLAVNPINTNVLIVPEDLKEKRFDDPEVIERYKRMLDFVFSSLPDVELVAVFIGNEVDAALQQDKEKWDQYQIFYEEISAYVRSKKPGTIVGCKTTFEGTIKSNVEGIKALNQHSDVVMVTYYPINEDFSVKDPSVIYPDIDELTSLYSGRTIYIAEAGYPSSPKLNSSYEKQQEFVRQIFMMWDKHDAQIKLIDFVWLNDLSKSELDSLTAFYGVSFEEFKEFLSTLGLRTYDGKGKMAFTALKAEAIARGW